mgnify:FL=1
MIKKVKYLENGYLDVRDLIENSNTFTFGTGGRGTGKTYGLCECLAEDYEDSNDKMFIYLRRRESESKAISTPETNPFLDLTNVKGSRWYKKDPPFIPEVLESKTGMIGFRSTKTDRICGYLFGLSTFYKVKSIPFPLVDIIAYDEFIPMSGARKFKDEYKTFTTMYETVNRNRELNGEKPCKFIAMSNSEMLGNPMYLGLGVVNEALKMQKDGKDVYNDLSRQLTIVILKDSPISERKANTALYQLNRNSTLNKVSLKNEFLYDDRLVKSKNLNGYMPIACVGELIIYRHKTLNDYYVRLGNNKGVRNYLATDEDLKRFQTRETKLLRAYISQKIAFETYEAQTIFLLYWDF